MQFERADFNPNDPERALPKPGLKPHPSKVLKTGDNDGNNSVTENNSKVNPTNTLDSAPTTISTSKAVIIPDINASISQTTSNTVSTTIDSIGLTPLGNLNNTLNQPLPSNNNPLNAGLEAAYSTQSVPIVKTGIESNVILNPTLISANINNNEITNAAERTSLTFSSANPNQPPLAATPLMNNLINALNITPKSPLTNLTDALNITSQRPLLVGLANLKNIENQNNLTITIKNLQLPHDYQVQQLNMDFKASVSLFINLLMQTMASSLRSNSYVKLALVVGLIIQFLNPLSAFAYKEGDFPGIGSEDAWNNAVKYMNQGNQANGEEACKFYLKAISIYPYDAAFWDNLGIETKDNNKAIEYYKKAIELNPEFIKPYINLGVTYRELGRHEESINWFQKALKLEPNNGSDYDSIGLEYSKLKKYKEAMPYFQSYIKLKPERDDGYTNLGCCYDGLNNFPKAIESYKQALLINPTNWINNVNLGLDLYRMGKIKEGLSFRDKAISLAKSKKVKDMIVNYFEDAKAGIYP